MFKGNTGCYILSVFFCIWGHKNEVMVSDIGIIEVNQYRGNLQCKSKHRPGNVYSASQPISQTLNGNTSGLGKL